jgi:hypothetical protein
MARLDMESMGVVSQQIEALACVLVREIALRLHVRAASSMLSKYTRLYLYQSEALNLLTRAQLGLVEQDLSFLHAHVSRVLVK